MATNHLPRKPIDDKPKPVPYVHPNIKAIFEFRYRVLINQMDNVPMAERKEFGTISTGDKKIDKAMAVSLIPVYLTINDMIEYHNQGIPMRLAEPSDSKKIFEAIINHTGVWRDALRAVFNVGNAPVEDLIAMETFAASIYDRAKFVYIERPKFGDIQQGSLAAFLYSNNSIEGTIFNTNRGNWGNNVAKRTIATAKTDKHIPNIDVFRDNLLANMTFEEE